MNQTNLQDLESFNSTIIFTFFLGFVLFLAAIFFVLWLGWWLTNRKGSKSPYSQNQLRYGEDLSYFALQRIQEFIITLQQPENSIKHLKNSAICQDTGRVFFNVLDFFGVVRLKKDFLSTRYPGNYVSWGSLTEDEKKYIASCHTSMKGFQVESSSTHYDPLQIDSYHATLKPGPLYVDKAARILLGWQSVPGTALEILVIQFPKEEPYTKEQ